MRWIKVETNDVLKLKIIIKKKILRHFGRMDTCIAAYSSPCWRYFLNLDDELPITRSQFESISFLQILEIIFVDICRCTVTTSVARVCQRKIVITISYKSKICFTFLEYCYNYNFSKTIISITNKSNICWTFLELGYFDNWSKAIIVLICLTFQNFVTMIIEVKESSSLQTNEIFV